MAVLEIREEPGRASMIDCAFFDGSSVGTLDAYRLEVRLVESGGRVRMGRAGRSRAEPIIYQRNDQCQSNGLLVDYGTHRQRFLPIGMPLSCCDR